MLERQSTRADKLGFLQIRYRVINRAPHAEQRMMKGYGGQFTGKLFKWTGGGAWTFVQVPERFALPVTRGWGRTPIYAAVDGNEWKTSVWRGKDARTLLAVPKKVRGATGDGDSVRVRIRFDVL